MNNMSQQESTIFDFIEQELKKRKSSKRALAEYLNVSESSLSTAFGRKSYSFLVKDNRIVKTASFLNIPVMDLLGELFSEGLSVKATPFDPENATEEEISYILFGDTDFYDIRRSYLRLNEKGKSVARGLMAALANMPEYQIHNYVGKDGQIRRSVHEIKNSEGETMLSYNAPSMSDPIIGDSDGE